MKNIKYISIIIAIILCFNFIMIPKQVQALGGGLAIGSAKIITMLLALAGMGVAINTAGKTDTEIATMAQNMLDTFENQGKAIRLTTDVLKDIVVGSTTSGVQALMEDVKSMVDFWDWSIGENTYTNSVPQSGLTKNIGGYVGTVTWSVENIQDGNNQDGWAKLYATHQINNSERVTTQIFGYDRKGYKIVGMSALTITNIAPWTYGGVAMHYKYTINITNWNGTNPQSWEVTKSHVAQDLLVTPHIPYELDTGIPLFNYNVSTDAYINTTTFPNYLPQPLLQPIPGFYLDTDIYGKTQVKYPGTVDDLVREITKPIGGMTYTDYKSIVGGLTTGGVNTANPGYTVTPDISVPGTSVIGYPNVTTGTPAIPFPPISVPYPNIGNNPAITDTGEYQGKSIGLLQGLTNFLALILAGVLAIPETIAKVFEIPEDLSLNFDNLRLSNFQNKFPFSIPWDIARALNLFSMAPSDPDLNIAFAMGEIEVNEQIDLSKISFPLAFARYVFVIFFMVFLAFKTRDIIKW